MTIGGLIVAFILLVISIFTMKAWLREFVFGAIATWFVFYTILLFGTSLLSKEKTLALNEPEEFCGFFIDCHMHKAVINVRKTKTLGNETVYSEFTL
jgi:hypothetical protein